jgi:diamine N-acetyltransferase
VNSKHAIRIATVEDASRIAVLGAQVWLQTYVDAGISEVVARYILETFAVKRVRALVEDSSAAVLVAEEEGRLAGYAVLRLGSWHGDISSEVETLYVQEPVTRRGIGSALLARSRDVALNRTGSRAVWLTVNSRNERALSFYRAGGFVADGITSFELGGVKYENTVMVGRG